MTLFYGSEIFQNKKYKYTCVYVYIEIAYRKHKLRQAAYSFRSSSQMGSCQSCSELLFL